MKIDQIISDIREGEMKSVYLLMGENSYFIDKISSFIEKNVLSASQREFDQTVIYGRDTSVEDIIARSRRLPMISERKIIVVREAQELSKSIENLASYTENPVQTTVLVICCKGKILDKRKKLVKSIEKNGIVFEAAKLYDSQVSEWIITFLKTKNYQIDLKSAHLLLEFLGNDLSKISNELDKLTTILPAGSLITSDCIARNIGISKDFNTFELIKAIGKREIVKCNRIVNFFIENPKKNPMAKIIPLIVNFFIQLLIYHGIPDKSESSIVKNLGINPYFVDDYVTASRNYTMLKVSQIISFLRDADLKSKGIGGIQISHGDLLKELLFKILH